MMKPASIVFLILGVSLSSVAWAGDPVPGVLEQWKTITQTFGEAMVKQGAMLLFGLAGIQFTLNGINALRKGSDLQELVMHMVWSLVTITFFFTCIIKSPTWFPQIINGWHALGASGTDTGTLDPGAIMSMGIDIVETMRSTVAAKSGASIVDFMRSVSISFQTLFVELFVLLAFLVLAGQLALAMLKAYLWLCLGPVLLGFGGLSYTKDVAMNTLKSGISIGVTILTCYVIAGMAQASVSIFNKQIASFELDNWVGLWNCVGVASLLAIAAWNVPKLASDFINGTVSGGLGETMATAAVAAGGAAALTGGVGSMMTKTASGAVDALSGLAQAGAAGMNSAHDLGKSGFEAVGHAVKEVASHGGSIVGGSARDMLDTSVSKMKEGANNSFGGRVAQSIDASRSGTMSPADGNRSSGSSGASSTQPGASTSGSTPSEAGASSSGTKSAGESSPVTSGMSSTSSQTGSGNAADAVLSQGGNANQSKDLSGYTAPGNSKGILEQIQDARQFIPPGGEDTVAVNAQLGGGSHE